MDEDEAEAPAESASIKMLAAVAMPDENLIETPHAFLTGVSTALKALNKVDADLATILSNHLLTVSPDANVIANAKAAILLLAARRAATGEE